MPSLSRSLVGAGVAAALAVLAVPAQAGSSGARLSDPAGDIAFSSMDVVSGLVRLDSRGDARGKVRTLSMSATMNGDLSGAPADYDLITSSRQQDTCHSLLIRLRWNGTSLVQAYQHTSTYACEREASPEDVAANAADLAQGTLTGDPVEAKAAGRTVSVSLPAPSWLRPGSLAGFAVVSHTTAYGVSVYAGTTRVGNFDMAALGRPWRVG